MSRTIDGNLGSARRAEVVARTVRRRACRDRFRRRRSPRRPGSRALRRRRAAAGRRRPASRRGPLGSVEHASFRGPAGDEERALDRRELERRARRTARALRPRPSRRRSPRCESARTSAAPAAAPHQANAAARPSPSAVNRLPVSNTRTSRRSRRRLWTHASTSPGSSDGRSTANFSDSGLAMAAGSDPWCAERQRGLPLDERERHRLGEAGGEENPADGAIARDPVVGRGLRRR